MVRSPPFQGGSTGSNPVGITLHFKGINMERLFSKVEKTDSCWNWKGATRGKNGYGAVKVDGKVVSVHKLFYVKYKGEIPEKLLVSHTCNNKLCVNPDHLKLVTAKENHSNGVKRGTIKPQKNEHLKVHPSLSAYRNGCRCEGCKELHRLAMRKTRAKRKALLLDIV